MQYDLHSLSNAEMHRHEGEARLAILESQVREPGAETPPAPSRWSRVRALGSRAHFGAARTPHTAAG